MRLMLNKTFLPEATARTAMETTESVLKKQKVHPPLSNRTLFHPSFMSLYTNPGVRQCCGDIQKVHPMIPQEFFYTDPTMICGTRIPNHVHELKDFDCFQLNTPPPIMSACLAPTHRPDPFRTEQHHTRNLGSSSWETGAPLPPRVNRMWVVIQMTQEEDQAITNLLKLHHGEGKSPTQEQQVDNQHSHTLTQCSDQINARLGNLAHSREATWRPLRKHWSDAELDVASTLLTQFGATGEDDGNWCCGKERVLSKSEEDALCGLLNLGLAQS